MPRIQSHGKCLLCDRTFSKAAMSRHLAKCLQSHVEAKPDRFFHLVVEGKYLPQYWLHLAVPTTATFGALDSFLRRIWLECCDHGSAFSVKRSMLSGWPGRVPWSVPDEVDMGESLGAVLRRGDKFSHEYDFGSTTKLDLKVVGEGQGELRGPGPVHLLARNDPPLIPCGVCGEPATLVSSEYGWSDESWLCKKCARARKVDREMCLPVVNSPRVGVCGYTG
jgi:hypothetical protein